MLTVIPRRLAWNRSRTSMLKVSAYQPEPWYDSIRHCNYFDTYFKIKDYDIDERPKALFQLKKM